MNAIEQLALDNIIHNIQHNLSNIAFDLPTVIAETQANLAMVYCDIMNNKENQSSELNQEMTITEERLSHALINIIQIAEQYNQQLSNAIRIKLDAITKE